LLLKKYKEVDEEATVEAVKKKVNSLRASYRRELQKIKRSGRSGAGVDDVYKPNIWYFHELHFLYDQESSVDGINTFDDGPEIEIVSVKTKSNVLLSIKNNIIEIKCDHFATVLLQLC